MTEPERLAAIESIRQLKARYWRGRDNRVSDGMSRFGIVSVHQGHQSDIEIDGPDTATGIWAFTDRMFFPPGGKLTRLTGYGFYHDTYVKTGEGWRIKTTRITRIRVEVA